jgi:hypothetical protein
MANRKKVRSQRKVPQSFSIQTSVLEEFRDLCSINNLNMSNVVNELISKHNKTLLNNGKTT